MTVCFVFFPHLFPISIDDVLQPILLSSRSVRALCSFINSSERSENTQRNADLISQKIDMPVKMFVAQDYSRLVEALRARRIDFAFFAPVSYVYAERMTDAKVLLKAERNGNPYYYGCIVVKDDDVEIRRNGSLL